MPRFPDFYAAKREEVPSYIQAEYLKQLAATEQADLERQKNVDRWNTVGQVNTGISDAMGEGESPIGSVLRAGKNAWANRGGQPPQGAAPQPGGSISRGPTPGSAIPGSGMSSRGLPSGQRQLANPSAKADAVRKLTPTPQTPTPTPKSSGGMPDFVKGTGLDANAALQGAGNPQVPAGRAGWSGGLNIPGSDMGKFRGSPRPSVTPTVTPTPTTSPAVLPSGMTIPTAKVGETVANKGVEQLVGNTAGKAGADAVGKGMGGAFAQAGGAVPVVGAVTGAIPAALRGDTMGAVKGAAGGAASSTLMAAGPAMAASGPVGWAGMAGLAALSLYGMLG
jgi:hypothetical protein